VSDIQEGVSTDLKYIPSTPDMSKRARAKDASDLVAAHEDIAALRAEIEDLNEKRDARVVEMEMTMAEQSDDIKRMKKALGRVYKEADALRLELQEAKDEITDKDSLVDRLLDEKYEMQVERDRYRAYLKEHCDFTLCSSCSGAFLYMHKEHPEMCKECGSQQAD